MYDMKTSIFNSMMPGSKLNIFKICLFFFATAVKITENHVVYEDVGTEKDSRFENIF